MAIWCAKPRAEIRMSFRVPGAAALIGGLMAFPKRHSLRADHLGDHFAPAGRFVIIGHCNRVDLTLATITESQIAKVDFATAKLTGLDPRG